MTDAEIGDFVKKCNDEQCKTADEIKMEFNDLLSKLCAKKILFIGDSITQDIRGYRGIITKAAQLESNSIAFSGSTSTDMIRKTYDAVKNVKPDIVSLMIGTNDAYFIDEDKKINLVSRDEYARNIRGILKTATKGGAKVVVGMIPPMDEDKAKRSKSTETKFNTNKNIEFYNKILLDEIKRARAQCIDTYSPIIGKSDYFEPDGVHITPVGHKLLAKKWIEAILKII